MWWSRYKASVLSDTFTTFMPINGLNKKITIKILSVLSYLSILFFSKTSVTNRQITVELYWWSVIILTHHTCRHSCRTGLTRKKKKIAQLCCRSAPHKFIWDIGVLVRHNIICKTTRSFTVSVFSRWPLHILSTAIIHSFAWYWSANVPEWT